MKNSHQKIIQIIKEYLENDPDLRFGQALLNLGINEFQKTTDPENPNYNLRDIHNDSDEEILTRIKKQLEWFDLREKVNKEVNNVVGLQGMTVNERLSETNLTSTFLRYKKRTKDMLVIFSEF